MRSSEVVIVGAGPAGMAAAVCARNGGKRVRLLDDNAVEGGQIWRGGSGSEWFDRLRNSGAELLTGCRVFSGNAESRSLQVETQSASFELRYESLILATGARELFLPFPGWTQPNVLGVGGLQALVKAGLPVAGKRVMIAGSGPLLLAVARYLRERGAEVPCVAEQTDGARLRRFGMDLLRHPAKLWQGAMLRASLGGSYVTGAWVKRIDGDLVHLAPSTARPIPVDYLAVAYGLRPNTELAHFLGCRIADGSVAADDFQETSVKGVYGAGEICGIGGVDLAVVEGQIAGHAAAGQPDLARRLFPSRGKARRFADSLNRTFAPREELRSLPQPETIVCRCEDARFGQLLQADSWRSGKLHFRCGMGACQGRICGLAVQFLFGWEPESVRPPVFPARVASLISQEATK